MLWNQNKSFHGLSQDCQPLAKVHLGKPEFRRRPVYELALTPEIGWEQALRKCFNVQARLEANFGSKELRLRLCDCLRLRVCLRLRPGQLKTVLDNNFGLHNA